MNMSMIIIERPHTRKFNVSATDKSNTILSFSMEYCISNNFPSKRKWLTFPYSGVCLSKYFVTARQTDEQFNEEYFCTSSVKLELCSWSRSFFSWAISSPGRPLFCLELFSLLVLSNSFMLPDTVSSFFRFCGTKLVHGHIVTKVITVSVLSLAPSSVWIKKKQKTWKNLKHRLQ